MSGLHQRHRVVSSCFFSCMNFFFEEEKRHPILSSGYLLVFHHCRVSELDCYDPMLHEVALAHSPDGTKWTILDAFLGLRGSVPDIVLRDNDFWIYALPESYLIDATTLKIKKGLV